MPHTIETAGRGPPVTSRQCDQTRLFCCGECDKCMTDRSISISSARQETKLVTRLTQPCQSRDEKRSQKRHLSSSLSMLITSLLAEGMNWKERSGKNCRSHSKTCWRPQTAAPLLELARFQLIKSRLSCLARLDSNGYTVTPGSNA
ncbi:hypothetical protein PoB_007524400 [Plakobranchus ocellatus]|uniref:Uncharacterized protein n=1 Tax=Plakobranchus ocellatus TaxID=259542 RepID=A0AAV4DXD3_9GAST|nr:hypothetical protein PoB_007524400 [Plakobranchus ocellatus]